MPSMNQQFSGIDMQKGFMPGRMSGIKSTHEGNMLNSSEYMHR